LPRGPKKAFRIPNNIPKRPFGKAVVSNENPEKPIKNPNGFEA
jgi:hypothetical protein